MPKQETPTTNSEEEPSKQVNDTFGRHTAKKFGRRRDAVRLPTSLIALLAKTPVTTIAHMYNE